MMQIILIFGSSEEEKRTFSSCISLYGVTDWAPQITLKSLYDHHLLRAKGHLLSMESPVNSKVLCHAEMDLFKARCVLCSALAYTLNTIKM